jgi:hypothetical protein
VGQELTLGDDGSASPLMVGGATFAFGDVVGSDAGGTLFWTASEAS